MLVGLWSFHFSWFQICHRILHDSLGTCRKCFINIFFYNLYKNLPIQFGKVMIWLFKHHNLTGSNVLGPCYLYHSVSSTQLLKSVQYLNFRLRIQIKHWPKIDSNSFNITYQNHPQSRPKLITFLENKVKLISKELWELKAQTKKMVNNLIKVLL